MELSCLLFIIDGNSNAFVVEVLYVGLFATLPLFTLLLSSLLGHLPLDHRLLLLADDLAERPVDFVGPRWRVGYGLPPGSHGGLRLLHLMILNHLGHA